MDQQGMNQDKIEFTEEKELIDLAQGLKSQLSLLVVCMSHSWGGLEQVAASDALQLGRLGVPVRVLCIRDTPIFQELLDSSEVKVCSVDFEVRNYFDFNFKKELFRHFSDGVNLVHTHQTTLLGSIAPWMWSHPRVGLIATRHIMSNHSKKDLFHQAIYSRLDFLVVMSQALRANVMDTHSIRERSVKVVNLGLDFDRFDPALVDPHSQRAQWGADDDTVVIGLVGRIDPAKGQATFIKAAAGLMKNLREGEKLKFVIVGEETLGASGDHLMELRKLTSQFHLQEQIVFAGFQQNIPEIMRSFDIFVMPSRQEAFGLVAIEAMAMGCPIVISSGGSADEIVGAEEFGLRMRPNDAFDLQRQLRFLLDHPAERVRMGKRGRDHVRRHYDRKRRLIKTLNLYERVLRRRRTGLFSENRGRGL